MGGGGKGTVTVIVEPGRPRRSKLPGAIWKVQPNGPSSPPSSANFFRKKGGDLVLLYKNRMWQSVSDKQMRKR